MTTIHFSLDVEADGPIPGPFSMSSFGVVAALVEPNRGWPERVDLTKNANQFYAELKPISDHFIPETAAISKLDRDALKQHGEDPLEAMYRFVEWIEATTERLSPGASATIVAWPAPYDWMWLYWYLMNYVGQSPFGHSRAINMKDYYAGRKNISLQQVGKRAVTDELKLSLPPHTHNALDDAIEQAVLWQAIKEMGL